MSYAIWVKPSPNQHFTAYLAGTPELSVTAASRLEAIHAVKQLINSYVNRGELVFHDPAPLRVTDLIGKYAEDDTLDDIVQAINLRREEELAALED